MTRDMLEGAGVIELLEFHGGGCTASMHAAVKHVLNIKKKGRRGRQKEKKNKHA